MKELSLTTVLLLGVCVGYVVWFGREVVGLLREIRDSLNRLAPEDDEDDENG